MIPSVPFQPHGSCELMAHAVGFAGDHGMNQRFGPLTCVFSLAMLAALPGDASAHVRHKQVEHDKKSDAAGKAGQHHAALKKEKHAERSARHKSESAAKARESTE